MRIKNCTPHVITTNAKSYKPSGLVIRLEYKTTVVAIIDETPIKRFELIGHNLPDKEEAVLLLVSTTVLNAFPDRNDLIAPNTNEATRDSNGQIVSVPGFVRFAYYKYL